MASVASALEAHEVYVERVKAEFHGPRYDWFLELLSRSDYWRSPVEGSCLYVLDFDGNVAPKRFGAHQQAAIYKTDSSIIFN